MAATTTSRNDAHTAVVIFSDATAATHDTGNLICTARGMTCVDTATLPGDTSTQDCTTDWNTGSATAFYAYCR